MSREQDATDQAIEQIARVILPLLYPDWPARWGWTEATQGMKNELLKLAAEFVEGIEI